MAVLAVAALGSAIGSATLGAGIFGISGASIGWLAGSMIGQSLFGPTIEGPKLADKKVQISAYGAPISQVYGGVRVAGNVFWSTDLVEHKRKEGGKGGPKVTKYSYSVSCAALLCEGPIVSIRRIWADSKVVYDARPEADPAGKIASAKFKEYWVLYTGTEDQLPDPTIEAEDGVGNVPAYRGSAYVVFTDLPLDDFGNRIPNFTFEISTEPEVVLPDTPLAPLIVYPWAPFEAGRPDHKWGAPSEYKAGGFGTTGISFGDDYAAAVTANAAYRYANSYGYGNNGMDKATEYLGFGHSLNPWIDKFSYGATINDRLIGSPQFIEYRYGMFQPDKFSEYEGTPSNFYVEEAAHAGCLADNGLKAYIRWTDLTINGLSFSYPSAIAMVFALETWEGGSFPDYGFVNFGDDGVVAGPRTVGMRVFRTPTVPLQACFPDVDPCIEDSGLAQLPDDARFCISCEGEVSYNYTYHEVTGTAKQLCAIEYRDNKLYQQARGPVLLPDDPDYDNADFWEAEFQKLLAKGKVQADVDYPVIVSKYAEADPLDLTEVNPGSIRLSEIVRDQCLRAGLTDYQIDVSELTDFVLGYVVGRQGSARQAIDQLRSAYFFDAVESGDIIKFVKRGHDPVATIPVDDLGASEDGGAVLMDHQRRQETELPATVNVVYSARSADYQNGTQISKRLTTRSEQEVTVELGIVMGDTKALQVADALLYDAWASRTTRILKVTRKWAHIEPTDVILVEDNEGFTYRLFVKDKTEDGGVITLECQDQDQSAYQPPDGFDSDDPDNSNIVPSNPGPKPPGSGPGGVVYQGPTKLLLLDLPLLQESDTELGYYVAATGYRPEWRGAFVYRSDDGGANYVEKAEITNAVTMGYAQTALGAFTGGNLIDEINSVDVRMHTGSLATITRSQLLNNGNVAALGREIIQFMRADLIAADRYRLSGLLRGRLGTEQHIGTHDVDDILVMLEPSKIYRVAESDALVNTEALYKAVTYGDPLTAASVIAFTDTGVSAKALSVVHLAAVPIDGGQYRLKWTRRARYGRDWLDYIDVPLDMESESYFVRSFRGTTQITRRTTTETTIDIAGLPGDVVQVAQVSDRVGLGFFSEITL